MTSNRPTKLSSLPYTVQKKVSLAMLKGRPGSLSVPSFSFRFNPTEDDGLEEVCEAAEGANAAGGSTSELAAAVDHPQQPHSKTPSPPTPSSNALKKSDDSPSTVKRSLRVFSLDDSNVPDAGTDTSWSLFSEIKGKIARTVEEKFRGIDLYSGTLLKKEADRGSPSTAKLLSETAKEASETLSDDSDEEAGVDGYGEVDSGPVAESFPQPSKTLSSGRKNSQNDTNQADVAGLRQRKVLIKSDDTGNGSEDGVTSSADTTYPLCSEDLQRAPSEKGDATGRIVATLKRSTLSHNKMLLAIGFFLLYQALPIPVFLNGFLVGCVCVLLAHHLWLWLTQPLRRKDVEASTPGEKSCPPFLSSPERNTPGLRKAWMNELLVDYSPDEFHVNRTQSVLVRLDGTTLRLSYPKTKVPKRAMWNETINDPTFIYQRLYDLEGAKITLVPEGLARKRRWSRRYPISIVFKKEQRIRETDTPVHLVKERKDTVVLFTRSARDKEDWFRKFEIAAGQELPADALGWRERSSQERYCLDYGVYMARLVPSPSAETGLNVAATTTTAAPGSTSSDAVPPVLKKEPSAEGSSGSATPTGVEGMAWMNALLGRCFWDFMREKEWAMRVGQKIQRKLSMIKVPYFIEELRLSDIELGSHLPQIGAISAPVLNERGLWVDMNLSYYGAFRMTLETKLNLMRLKKGEAATLDSSSSEVEFSFQAASSDNRANRSSSLYDSEAEESVESSSDEDVVSEATEGGPVSEEGAAGSGRTGRKILRFVDTIAQSRYFQNVAEYKYIKKAMEGVSNTPLILTVELLNLCGTLVINIPPPPTDRLWYGFRTNPRLTLVAKPKVGEREVQISHIVDWIEKKLVLEFQRVLVLPNMDDLIVPIMNSGFPHSANSPRDQSPLTPTSSQKN